MSDSINAVLFKILDIFDSMAESVPVPGSNPQLPGNIVLLDRYEVRSGGLGNMGSESFSGSEGEMVVMRGTALVEASFCLWDAAAGSAAARSREFIGLILNTRNSDSDSVIEVGGHLKIVFSDARFNGTKGPDYIDELQIWKLCVSGSFDVDYELTRTGTGHVIDRVGVNMPGSSSEDFEVSG